VAVAADAYAEAMAAAAAVLPSEANVLYLAAAAQLNLAPWDYWRGGSHANGSAGAARPHAAAAEAMLDAALAAAPRHHGALHLKVHLLEAHATRAVEATPYAEALRDVAAELLPG
jgi:hypothetical protein